MQLPEKDRYTQGKRKLLGMLVGLMGGRAAEELACSDITTGAQNDLKQATRIARLMVCEWGMSPALGPQSFGEREELLFLGREVSRSQDYSEATAQKIDVEVSRMLHEAYQKALDILRAHRDKLDLITQLLIERETLDGREVEELIEHGRILTEVERGGTTGDSSPSQPASAPAGGPPAPAPAAPPVIGPDARPSLA
jgi:cell division protease FtsH